MQALEWAAAYPAMVRSVIPIASTCKRSALSIGLCEAQRQAIMADPDWNNGDYYDREPPRKGLALARIIGHITYLSEASMQRKFGRRLQDNAAFKFDFTTDFQVESYLHHQGRKFVDRFDANSYLYITKAADYFDLGEQRGDGSLVRAFSRTAAKYLVISFSSDWLFPTVPIPGDGQGHDEGRPRRQLLRNRFRLRPRFVPSGRGPDDPAHLGIPRPGRRGGGAVMRFDLRIVTSFIEEGSRVLDLGCGTGDLLSYLRENKKVEGRGIEIDEKEVIACVEKGLPVLQGDMHEETRDLADGSFDYVILSQTLQQVYRPEQVIGEMLRIGKTGHRQLPLLQPLCHQGPTAFPEPGPGHEGASLPVVRHSEHPGHHPEGLPEVLRRPGDRASSRRSPSPRHHRDGVGPDRQAPSRLVRAIRHIPDLAGPVIRPFALTRGMFLSIMEAHARTSNGYSWTKSGPPAARRISSRSSCRGTRTPSRGRTSTRTP